MPNLTNLPLPLLITLGILSIIWELTLKGIALWRSAKQADKWWFIVLVILSPINLLGIPQLIYLLFISKQKLTLSEIKSWIPERKAKKK